MTTLTTSDINLLIKLFKMNQNQLHDFLYNELAKNYGKSKIVHKYGKYLIAVGGKIGLVAHLDVYGGISPTDIVYNKKYMTAINNVLGADDRVGVFIILKMLEKGFRPTVLFTHDEEKGTLGATALANDFSDLGVNYLLQLDRRGGGVVFYDNDNREFLDYVLSFRDKEEFGSYSDISVLCPRCEVSGCNLGVGYYNEHSKGEYLDFEILSDTLDVVIKMLEDEENSKFFEYIEAEYMNKYYGSYPQSYGGSTTSVFYNGEYISLERYYEIIYGFAEEDYIEVETKIDEREQPF